jgi:hypothetical protein
MIIGDNVVVEKVLMFDKIMYMEYAWNLTIKSITCLIYVKCH